MASASSERELHQPATHCEQAAEHRRLAAQLGRAGYRDQAARHLLEARLLELKAAAFTATSRAA
jgi:hypothetical protein